MQQVSWTFLAATNLLYWQDHESHRQTHDPYAVSLTHGRHDKSEPIESPHNTRDHISKHLRALATDATGELNVLGHDGHALGMDGAEVGVREEANKVGLRGLLERDDG